MTKTPDKQSHQPGIEAKMNPAREYIKSTYTGSKKLLNKVALVTGGDSGIGRAVSVHFAREGADVLLFTTMKMLTLSKPKSLSNLRDADAY